MSARARRTVAAGISALALAGCVGRSSVLDPAGRYALSLERQWWINLGVTAAVFAIVMAVAARGVWKSRTRGGPRDEVIRPVERHERRGERIVLAALALSALLLAGLGYTDLVARRALKPVTGEPLVVKVTGHQWWWEFEYQDPLPSNAVNSPGALHLPVGRDVRLELVSHDVIHSFWVPNLTGKRDLIPGHPASLMIHATRPGTFVGECAEFCGHQHATMRFVVVCESPARFAAWRTAQSQVPPPPATAETNHGRDVFLASSCMMCHTIRGTGAASRVGPDLTHVGSRPALAGATLPNTQGHLMAWIADPQATRPGVKMPPNALDRDDLVALTAYLTSLR